MQDIDNFIKLINEDKDLIGSEKKLELKTGVSKGTINSWRGNLKYAPRIDTLQQYVSNIDAPKERKRLYYEYCGYTPPVELQERTLTEIIESNKDFVGYQSDITDQEVAIPIVGEITCGTPTFAEVDLEGYEYVLRKDITDADYHIFLRVRGDSMNQRGILNGSLVLIAKTTAAESGNIVAVCIDSDTVTVKEMIIQDGFVLFSPCSSNPEHKPFIFPIDSEDYTIFGVVTKIITNL